MQAMGWKVVLLVSACAFSSLSGAVALNFNLGYGDAVSTNEATAPATNASSIEDRVLVVVLGHGQPERSVKMLSTLYDFYQQLGPDNFDCMVFVWNSHMVLPVLPPGCEIKVTPGVFMEYTSMIPEERLQAAKYAYIMADDVTLDAPGHFHMNISALRDLAVANCLDVLTPAHYHPNYKFLAPDENAGAGRMLQFLEFQATLVTPTMVHLLAKLASTKITGCWGYDALLYTAVQKWTGREPRLGIADEFVVNVGAESMSGHRSEYTKKVRHPCGKVDTKHGIIFHTAANDQMRYWIDHDGLEDYHKGHEASVGRLVAPGSPGTISRGACTHMLAPGELALTELDFSTWLAGAEKVAQSLNETS
mmetsp:Transcript_53808/g.99461  ORF Transcript_53808/g.99461 Transcript_53808/m.99461 type:complete len:363 (-) Transcript_53808:37-1125(-)